MRHKSFPRCLVVRQRLVGRHEVLPGLPVQSLQDAFVRVTTLLQPLRLKERGGGGGVAVDNSASVRVGVRVGVKR